MDHDTTWRLRVRLDDRPGALARLTARLAAREANVLSLSVLPVPDGVVDDLVVRAGPDLLPADLVSDVRAEGGQCVGITRADVRSLVDHTTAALRAVAAAVRDPATGAEALRTLLAADSVGPRTGDEDRTGHRTSLPGTDLVASRGWAPFTEVELARAAALAEVLGACEAEPDTPTAVLTTDGAAVVLRRGTPGDADAVTALHTRCSAETVFARYHAGTRTLPRRWLYRLLSPPRGSTLVAVCGHELIGMAQLIRTATPDVAEVSVLVEDGWQRRGLGTAMLRRLAATARAEGHRELVAWCLPTETAFTRTAMRSRTAVSVRQEDGMTRIGLLLGPSRTCYRPVTFAMLRGDPATKELP